MAVTGAILGDIAGSQYEFHRPKNLDWRTCELFSDRCKCTDDTVMTLAVKKAILEGRDLTETMRDIGKHYPDSGYGGRFYQWMYGENPQPYNSYGNGSAMRAAFVGEYFESLSDVVKEAEKTAAVSHNHPEGVKGAVVTAVCIWMAKHGKSKQDIYDYVLEQYPPEKYAYSVDKNLEFLENNYKWNETCMDSVPAAMRCFYESESFEGFLRNLFRFDCDMDTLGAIGGGVAEEFYKGVGFEAESVLKRYLDERLYGIYQMH